VAGATICGAESPIPLRFS